MGQASTTLTVSTAQAIAELDAVIAKAREARALTQGLPSPAAIPTARSVRLPQTPTGDVPGGKAPELQSRTYMRTLEDQYGVTEVLGAKSSPVPRVSGPGAAASRALSDVPRPPLDLKPPTGATLASDLAGAQGMDRLVSKLSHAEISRGKLEVGPLELGASGVSVQGNFARKILPAAVYGMIAYGALKTLREGLDLEHETIVEAAKTGRDPVMLFIEKGGQKAAGLLGKGLGAFGGVAEEIAATSVALSRSLAGGSLGYTPLGAAVGKIADFTGYAFDAQRADGYARGVADLFAKQTAYITGASSAPQLDIGAGVRGIRAGTDALAGAIARAHDWAAENARKAADQLQGLGYPGTRRELREAALHEIKQGKPYQQKIDEGVKMNLATGNGE